MTSRNRSEKYEKFGLQFTQGERTVIVDVVASLPKEIARSIEATTTKQPIMMTLDDWREFAGHIASDAKDAGDKKLQKKLDAIVLKVQHLLDSHTDEQPPTWKEIKQRLAVESVQLAEWAQRILIRAEQLGIKTKTVSLPGVEVLMITPTIDENIKKKLAANRPKLTVGEIGGLLITVSEALIDAPPLQQFALISNAKHLKECLEAEVNGRSSLRPRGLMRDEQRGMRNMQLEFEKALLSDGSSQVGLAFEINKGRTQP